jgi:hypothetical protein
MTYITGRAEHPLVRFLKYLLVFSIILAIAGGYLFLHPDIWQEWVKGTPLEPPPTVTKMYKWQDADGQWQLTDRQPGPGIKYEILIYNSNANIVPAVPTEDK